MKTTDRTVMITDTEDMELLADIMTEAKQSHWNAEAQVFAPVL